MKLMQETPGSLLIVLALASGLSLPAQTITWKGHTWKVTNGGMAGVAPGSINNVSIDANDYLHLRITKSGSNWTAAELFSSDKMGFGTYQWQFEGAVDNFDKCVVLGLFPYGPAQGIGGDGENELDIEFSKWNGTVGAHNADFTYYPATGHGDGNRTPAAYEEFTVSLSGGNLSTARTVWSSKSVTSTIMTGLQAVGSEAGLLHTYAFTPTTNWTQKIPQVALPLGINFWCFGTTPATNQEIIIRDFQFIPEGTQPITYTINASAGAGGSISPSGSVIVRHGDSQTYTFAPHPGYAVSTVTVDGRNNGAIPSYVFSNVQSPHSISVAFTPISPLVSVTIRPKTASLAAGAMLQFTASVTGTENSGVTWTSSGGTVNASGLYTAPAIAGTYNVRARSAVNITKSDLATITVTSGGSSNIAPTGAGYLWSKNSSGKSNSNRVRNAAINDNNLTNSVVINPTGEGGSALWEGAGVLWTAAKTITSATFVNGVDDGHGNGYFQAGCRLQFSTDGTNWTNSGWALAPNYPNNSSVYGQTYTFSGTAATGVKGARIMGQTGASSWSWTVSEVQFMGN